MTIQRAVSVLVGAAMLAISLPAVGVPLNHSLGQTSLQASDAGWTPPATARIKSLDFVEPDSPFVSRVAVAEPSSSSSSADSLDAERFAVGSVAVSVDRRTGRPLLDAVDVSISAAGQPLRFERYFRGGTGTQTTMGHGWSSSADRGLRLEDSIAALYTPTGLRIALTPAADGGYVGPAGSGLVLTRKDSSTERTFLLTDTATGHRQEFSANGYLTRETDGAGFGVLYRYDAAGRLVAVEDPLSDRNLAFGYSSGLLTSITDSAGRVTSYSYDRAERLSRVTDGAGAVTSFRYDRSGHLVEVDASTSGSQTAGIVLAYDVADRVTSVTRKADAQTAIVTTFGYDTPAGTTVTDPRHSTTTYAFDDAARTTSRTDALGAVSSVRWADGRGGLASVTEGSNDVVSNSYDADGDLTATTLPTGAIMRVGYDDTDGCSSANAAPEQVTCVIDAQGNRLGIDYTTAGDVAAVSDGVGVLRRFDYAGTFGPVTCAPGVGLVCAETDGNGVTTSYRYDHARQLVALSVAGYADGDATRFVPTTSYDYDSIGRITAITQRRADSTTATTSLRYDRADRVVGVTYPDGAKRSVTFNADGTVASRADVDGSKSAYRYDHRGLLTRTVTGIDSDRRIDSFDYDAAGNLTAHTDESGTARYRYGPTDLLASIGENGADCTDEAPAASSGCTVIERDARGIETVRLFPGGARQTTERDASRRVTGITATDASGVLRVAIGYDYHNADGADTMLIGSRTSTIDEGIASGAVTHYSYDARDRLTSAVETATDGSTTATWSYEYDGADNRTSQSRTGATATGTTPLTPIQTTAYSYDRFGRLSATGADTARWTYDAEGDQSSNGITGDTREFDVAAVETDAPAVALTMTPTGEATGFRSNGAPHYYVHDSLGSVIGMFDASGSYEGGYSYSPFGEQRAAAASPAVATNPVRYVGGIADASNPDLYRLGVRHYDASLGRFLEPDPVATGRYDYDYAHQDPINFVDRNGLWPTTIDVLANVVLAQTFVACLSGSLNVCLVLGFGSWATSLASLIAGVENPPEEIVSSVSGSIAYVVEKFLPFLATSAIVILIAGDRLDRGDDLDFGFGAPWDFGFGW